MKALTPADHKLLRAGLAACGADGWLLFDFQGHSPVANRLLALGGLGSRRLFALLVPDQPEVLGALRGAGVLQFPLSVEAPVAPSPSGIHQSAPTTVRLAFPRYRVFFYNTTPRTSEATLFSYLGNS